MRISRDEISEILSQTTTLLGQLLATMNELREDTIYQRQASAQQAKVDRIKRELDDEREQIKRLRYRQQVKRELERSRKERESHRQHEGRGGGSGLVALRNARGQLIGWLRPDGQDRLEVLDSKGRLVAREIRGITLNAGGRLVGHGRLGLAVLGANSPKNLF
jgi:hypothetical protein